MACVLPIEKKRRKTETVKQTATNKNTRDSNLMSSGITGEFCASYLHHSDCPTDRPTGGPRSLALTYCLRRYLRCSTTSRSSGKGSTTKAAPAQCPTRRPTCSPARNEAKRPRQTAVPANKASVQCRDSSSVARSLATVTSTEAVLQLLTTATPTAAALERPHIVLSTDTAEVAAQH